MLITPTGIDHPDDQVVHYPDGFQLYMKRMESISAGVLMIESHASSAWCSNSGHFSHLIAVVMQMIDLYAI